MVEIDDEVKSKVLKQVEFYFSDSNLPKDKFLKQQVDAHSEGYVDLSLIVSFTRMRDLLKLGGARPEDIADDVVTAVADVLRQSTALTVSESGFQVKRAAPLPSAKEAARAVDSRSLYVRPFPMTTTLDDITSFYRHAGVAVNAVRVRRHQRSKEFKGSIFLECASPEEADRVLHLQLEFEGAPLRSEKKQAYLARKIAERRAKNAAAAAAAAPGAEAEPEQLTLAMLEEMDSDCEIPALTAINKNIHLTAAAAAGGQQQQQQQPGGQKRKAPEGNGEAAAAAAAEDGAAAGGDAEMADAAAPAAAAEPESEQHEPGCILLLTLSGQPDEPDSWKIISMVKEAFGKEKIRFVEQQQQQDEGEQQQQQDKGEQQQQQQAEGGGTEEAADGAAAAAAAAGDAEKEDQSKQLVFMVRFRQAADAKAALDSAAAAEGEGSGGLTVAGCPAQLKLVEGRDEEEFYKRAAVNRAAAAKRGDDHHRGGHGRRRGRGRGGGRGGRGGNRGGSRGGRGGANKRGRH